VAIAQASIDTGVAHERAGLKTLLSTLDLNGVLIQRMRCIHHLHFQLTAEQGADMLLTVKQDQSRQYRQVASQFSSHRHCPVEISDIEASHGRRVRWSLHARNTTDAICERWSGATGSPNWRAVAGVTASRCTTSRCMASSRLRLHHHPAHMP
jgi:hypothetical protein